MQTLPAASDPVANADDEIGRGSHVDRYLILDLIGEGGMGTVFSAHDGSLDRTIALKIVRSAHHDRAAQARLVREAKAMARVQHPAIVAVHDVGNVGARVFIAMELVRGTTLRGWLDAAQRTWREIVRMFVAAGRGLEAAHTAGVIHRDFKPENVLVDDAGRPRVGDFGLAEVLAGGADSAAPLSAGTPWYMAPEQLDRGTVDARSDQFSFCVALWWAVYGRHPFSASPPAHATPAPEEVSAVIAAVTGGALADPPAGVSARVAAALRTGLARDPAARHPSMTELLAALERALEPRTARTVVPIAAVVAVVAVAAAVIWSGDRGPLCDAAAEPIAARWDSARRGSVERALGTASASVLPVLDRYAAGWRDQRIDACRATYVRGEQSGDLLDLRMQCLDRRLGELDALANVLASGDPTVVSHASRAVNALVPLGACSDVVALREVVPPPADPRLRARVTEVRAQLTAVKAELDTGRYAKGYAAIEPIARDAELINYSPLIAEAELLHGALAWRTEHMEIAETALYRSIASGEAGRASDITARAWLELLWFVSQERGQHAEALRLGVLARGAVDRYAGDPVLTATLAERLGVAALDLGKLDDAALHLQRAYDLRVQQRGKADPSAAASLQHLAMLAAAQGDHAAALARHKEAHAAFELTLGPEHPHTLIALNAVAAELKLTGKLDEAYALFERGLAASERTQGTETYDAAMYRCNMGIVLGEQAKLPDAIAMLRRSLAIFTQVRGGAASEVAFCGAQLAGALRKAGRHDEAIEVYQQVMPTIEKVAGPTSVDLATALSGLGRSLVAVNRKRDAEAALARALPILERGDDVDATYAVRVALDAARAKSR